MGLDGDHLLKRLRPVAAPATSSPPGTARGASGFDGTFARLIRLAEGGRLDSQRPVNASSTQQLSEEQLESIGRACDSLESAGLDDAQFGDEPSCRGRGLHIRQELDDPTRAWSSPRAWCRGGDGQR